MIDTVGLVGVNGTGSRIARSPLATPGAHPIGCANHVRAGFDPRRPDDAAADAPLDAHQPLGDDPLGYLADEDRVRLELGAGREPLVGRSRRTPAEVTGQPLDRAGQIRVHLSGSVGRSGNASIADRSRAIAC